jgi:hypothetical protein
MIASPDPSQETVIATALGQLRGSTALQRERGALALNRLLKGEYSVHVF